LSGTGGRKGDVDDDDDNDDDEEDDDDDGDVDDGCDSDHMLLGWYELIIIIWLTIIILFLPINWIISGLQQHGCVKGSLKKIILRNTHHVVYLYLIMESSNCVICCNYYVKWYQIICCILWYLFIFGIF